MSIERDVYVLKDAIKTPIDYVRGTNAIPIVFHFRDYDIPSGSIAAVYVKKPSGNAVYNNASVSGNDVTVDVTTQMFAEFGQNILQIQISKNNDNLVTFSQPVNVHENNTDEDATKSENESTILQDVKAATAAANEAAESANDAAEEAESKARAADQAAQGANAASQQIQQNAAAGNYSASVSVGTVTTGDPGTQAQIYNSGTKKDAIFNFIIPQGPQGETGPQGPEGPQGPAGSLDDIEDATVTFSQASSRININSGDSIGTLFGKIRKWFADLGTAAFQGVSNALTQTTSGYVLDARQGKTLADRIGTLSSLLTTAKTSLVNAVNELFNKIGDLDDLDTTEKSDVVGAINEINAGLSDGIKIVDILECTVQYSSTIGAGAQNTCTGTITSDKKISDCKFIGLFVCSNYGIPVDEPTFTPRGDNSVTVRQVVRNYTDVAHTVVTTMIVICYK